MLAALRRLRTRREAARLEAILNGPATFRVTRPGWEGTSYYLDPENPRIALAMRPTLATTAGGYEHES